MAKNEFSMHTLAISMKGEKIKASPETVVYFFPFEIYFVIFFYVVFCVQIKFLVLAISSVLLHSIPLREAMDLLY